jgi:hypothetical protein
LAERQDPGPVFVTVGVLACVEDDGFLPAGTEPILQEAEAAQVFATDAGARLDLEADDLAVVAFEDEVYLLDSHFPTTGFRKSRPELGWQPWIPGAGFKHGWCLVLNHSSMAQAGRFSIAS